MLKGHPSDGLGPDHLQMQANPCGVIISIKVNDEFEATSAQVGHWPCRKGLHCTGQLLWYYHRLGGCVCIGIARDGQPL